MARPPCRCPRPPGRIPPRSPPSTASPSQVSGDCGPTTTQFIGHRHDQQRHALRRHARRLLMSRRSRRPTPRRRRTRSCASRGISDAIAGPGTAYSVTWRVTTGVSDFYAAGAFTVRVRDELVLRRRPGQEGVNHILVTVQDPHGNAAAQNSEHQRLGVHLRAGRRGDRGLLRYST